MFNNKIIRVDSDDKIIGSVSKIEAHRKGILHRAFSIFVLNEKNEMLLQQRSSVKYHSPNLWSNACCSHPSFGEEILGSCNRRLEEEMGFKCELHFLFKFRYNVAVGNDMFENEIDHVYLGSYNGNIKANYEEVRDFRFLKIEEIDEQISRSPDKFTVWFRMIMPELSNYVRVNTF